MQRPAITPADSRVLRYRPRTSDDLPGRPLAPRPPSSGPQETADDFRHRMRVNIAAFVFTAVLTTLGIWLAFGIADMRALQDCALTGRRNCATIPAPQTDGAAGGPRFVNTASELP